MNLFKSFCYKEMSEMPGFYGRQINEWFESDNIEDAFNAYKEYLGGRLMSYYTFTLWMYGDGLTTDDNQEDGE
jgi:hypothetical protein